MSILLGISVKRRFGRPSRCLLPAASASPVNTSRAGRAMPSFFPLGLHAAVRRSGRRGLSSLMPPAASARPEALAERAAAGRKFAHKTRQFCRPARLFLVLLRTHGRENPPSGAVRGLERTKIWWSRSSPRPACLPRSRPAQGRSNYPPNRGAPR